MMAKRTGERGKGAALGKALRGMFKRLEDRPVPERLMSVVDQLAAAETLPLRKKNARG